MRVILSIAIFFLIGIHSTTSKAWNIVLCWPLTSNCGYNPKGGGGMSLSGFYFGALAVAIPAVSIYQGSNSNSNPGWKDLKPGDTQYPSLPEAYQNTSPYANTNIYPRNAPFTRFLVWSYHAFKKTPGAQAEYNEEIRKIFANPNAYCNLPQFSKELINTTGLGSPPANCAPYTNVPNGGSGSGPGDGSPDSLGYPNPDPLPPPPPNPPPPNPPPPNPPPPNPPPPNPPPPNPPPPNPPPPNPPPTPAPPAYCPQGSTNCNITNNQGRVTFSADLRAESSTYRTPAIGPTPPPSIFGRSLDEIVQYWGGVNLARLYPQQLGRFLPLDPNVDIPLSLLGIDQALDPNASKAERLVAIGSIITDAFGNGPGKFGIRMVTVADRHGVAITVGRVLEEIGDELLVVYKNINGKSVTERFTKSAVGEPMANHVLKRLELGNVVTVPGVDGKPVTGLVSDFEGVNVVVAINENGALRSITVPPQRVSTPVMDIADNPNFLPIAVQDLRLAPNLAPSNTVSVLNATISIGDFFEDYERRIFVIARVTADGVTRNRVFYRSRAEGVFRTIPARNMYNPRVRTYESGPFDSAMNNSPGLQKFLADKVIDSRNTQRPILDPIELAGIIPVNFGRKQHNAWTKSRDFFNIKHLKQLFAHDTSVPTPIRNESGIDFPEPEDIRFENPFDAPDYENILTRYILETEYLGNVEAFVYRSYSGKYEFTVFRDQGNHIWFADIGLSFEPLNTHGVRQRGVSSPLLVPLWSGLEDAPKSAEDFLLGMFTDSTNTHPIPGSLLQSNWDYLRQIPEIQTWYRHHGIPIPD